MTPAAHGRDDSRFEHRFTVRIHDTDTVGILFFGHLFRHAQDACEGFLEALGFPLPELLQDRRCLLPLIHAEADYRHPLRHGDRVRVAVRVAELRRRSLALDYTFITDQGTFAATARTVHVQVDADFKPADALLPELRRALGYHGGHRSILPASPPDRPDPPP